MDQGKNRVFINPNFNNRVANNVPMRHVTVMHVNPNFCQQTQNVQPTSKARIYVNPNFVRPNIMNNQTPYVNYNTITPYTYGKPTPLMDTSNSLVITSTMPVSTATSHEVQISNKIKSPIMQPIQTHSRYSLVRQKKVEGPPTNIINTNKPKPQTITVKINKYKSIKITDVKRSLDSVAPVEKRIPFKVSNSYKIRTTNTEKIITKTPNAQNNRYKFVRPTSSLGKPQLKRQTSGTPRKVVSTRTKIKAIGMYKKNNIPCPQFRKYGKCLRKSYGKCEFLHDKRHVSICRKFLNGVCHNDKCLLSHELSDKKMPTCYFFLKGICTKEGCPYLHVKLNEKAKLCPDFMKGYCEKGETCLNRHVTVSSNIDLKRRLSLNKMLQQKLMKYTIEKNRIKNNMSSIQKRKGKVSVNSYSHEKDSSDRYYKDSLQESNTDENLEMIKPTRCKLGTLPSFIQL